MINIKNNFLIAVKSFAAVMFLALSITHAQEDTEPPVITTAPIDLTVTEGASASLSVVASGAGLIYQWSTAGINIAGATAPNFTIDATTLADS